MAFDNTKIKIKPLKERVHDLDLNAVKPLKNQEYHNKNFRETALRMVQAKKQKKEIIMMIGGHVMRSGVQRYIINLMEKGYITCIVMNGACIIHDYELSLIGATTESVARYLKEGQFGLWKETGVLNDIINQAYKDDHNAGLGETIGQAIANGDYLYSDLSLLAKAFNLGIPVTVHVGIGYDIIHEHPNCDGAATGALSYNDFLKFVSVVQYLEDGVVMNFGSAVMAPEVFLKALSMARNVAHQEGRVIKHFTTLVCDLYDLPDDFSKEPCKDNAAYYFRPWKTMLVRAVADGGESFYIKGKHANTIPALWTAIKEIENKLQD